MKFGEDPPLPHVNLKYQVKATLTYNTTSTCRPEDPPSPHFNLKYQVKATLTHLTGISRPRALQGTWSLEEDLVP